MYDKVSEYRQQKNTMEQSLEALNKTLVEQTLIFHGLPLIKTWNEEYGVNSLTALGIQPANIIDTSLYHARQKNLSYTDRSKRMKLHNFICSKSTSLFKIFREDPSDKRIKKLVSSGGSFYSKRLCPTAVK